MLRVIIAIGAIQSSTVLLNLIRSKTIAILLGPAGAGAVSVMDQTAYVVAQISAFGLPFAALKFLSRSHSEGIDPFKRSYAGFLRLLVAFTLTVTAISIGVVLVHPDLLGSQLSAYRTPFVLALLNAPNMAIQGFLAGAMSAAQRARTSALIALVAALALAVATFGGISLAGIPGYYGCNLLAGVVVTIAGLTYFRKRLGMSPFGRTISVREEWRRHPDITALTLIMYGSSFAYPLALLVARYTVLAEHGKVDAGLLNAAVSVSSAIALVLGPATNLYLTPVLNRNSTQAEKMRAAFEFQRKLVLVVGAVAVPMVLFPRWMLMLLFSAAFVGVSHILFLFVIAQSVLLLAGVYQALLIGLDDLKAYGIVVAVGYVSLGICALELAPRYGILGVSIGFLVASIVIFLLTVARLSLRHALELPPELRAMTAFGLLAVLLAGSLSNYFDHSNLITTLSKGGLYVVFIVGLLVLFRGPNPRPTRTSV